MHVNSLILKGYRGSRRKKPFNRSLQPFPFYILSLSAQLVNHAAVKFGRTMNASPMKTRYIVKIDLLILETACCTDLTISNKHIASKVSFVVHEDN